MRCPACDHELGNSAKFCPECGTPTPVAARTRTSERTALRQPLRTAGLSSDAERRQVTVLFCDLVGSTALSARLDPEDMRAVIRTYQEVASREVVRFGGHVAQYTGDGILAYFGYPTAFEDAAPRAVGSALSVLAAIERLRAANAAGSADLHARIGIHTGLAVIGEVGGHSHTERLAIGETPNVAARIQAVAEPNTVYISNVTAGLVAKRFRIERVDEFSLKGVPEPMVIYRALQPHDALDESTQAAATPLVDRDAERGVLLRAWVRARGGSGSTVLVTGEAGIGKSRVLQFLRDQVDVAAGDARLDLRCQSMHRESAFHPFIEHLQATAGFDHSDEVGTRLEKLTRMIEHRAPEVRDDLAVFAALLLLPPPPDAEPIDPMALRGRIERALEGWVMAQALGPLLIVVEDLHWADTSTLDVLTRVVAASRSARILVAMSGRPDFVPPHAWHAGLEGGQIDLQRLTSDNIRVIVANVSAGSELPSRVIDQLLERIDGVPIYAEELTKSILSVAPRGYDDDRGGRDQEAWRGNVAELVVPASLQDSLMARLDRLGPIRGFAQMGAVIGREFDYQTLLALSRADEAVLQRALLRLTDSDILIQSGALPRARFSFRHALLHEVTYGALLRDARHDMHAAVGRVLEQSGRGPDADAQLTDDERVRLLSYHWDRAVSPKHPAPDRVEKAITYAIQAGEQELARSGYREAESRFRRALDHLASLPRGPRHDELELRARVRLATVHKATVGPAAEQVREELSRCRDLCLQLGDRPELGAVLHGFWQLHLFRAQYPLALSLAEECRREALRAGDDDLLIQAHVALANTQFWFCDLEASLANATAALERYDAATHARHAVRFGMDPAVLALMSATWIGQLRGETDVARTHHEALRRLSSELDHPMSKALALNTSCCYYVNAGDVDGARASGDALLALAQAHGLPVYAMFGVLFRGWAIAEQGNVAEVLEEVRQTYHNYVTYVGGLAQTYAALLVSGVYARAGCIDDAIAVLNDTMLVAGADSCREQAYEAELLRLKAELLARRDAADSGLIRGMLAEAVALAERRGEHLIAARAARTLESALQATR